MEARQPYRHRTNATLSKGMEDPMSGIELALLRWDCHSAQSTDGTSTVVERWMPIGLGEPTGDERTDDSDIRYR